MRSNRGVTNKNRTIGLILTIVVCFLYGCSAIGTQVAESKRIALTGSQENSGTFKQGMLTIDYNFRLSGDNITLSGKVGYFGGVDSLDVRVLFFDQQGTVIEQKMVYSVPYRKGADSWGGRNFEKELKVPANAAGFTFDYSSQDRRNKG